MIRYYMIQYVVHDNNNITIQFSFRYPKVLALALLWAAEILQVGHNLRYKRVAAAASRCVTRCSDLDLKFVVSLKVYSPRIDEPDWQITDQ